MFEFCSFPWGFEPYCLLPALNIIIDLGDVLGPNIRLLQLLPPMKVLAHQQLFQLVDHEFVIRRGLHKSLQLFHTHPLVIPYYPFDQDPQIVVDVHQFLLHYPVKFLKDLQLLVVSPDCLDGVVEWQKDDGELVQDPEEVVEVELALDLWGFKGCFDEDICVGGQFGEVEDVGAVEGHKPAVFLHREREGSSCRHFCILQTVNYAS